MKLIISFSECLKIAFLGKLNVNWGDLTITKRKFIHKNI